MNTHKTRTSSSSEKQKRISENKEKKTEMKWRKKKEKQFNFGNFPLTAPPSRWKSPDSPYVCSFLLSVCCFFFCCCCLMYLQFMGLYLDYFRNINLGVNASFLQLSLSCQLSF